MHDSLLSALDARRAEFLAGLDSVPPEQRERAPSTRAWSPLGIGEHSLIVESGLARIMARQIEKWDDRRRFDAPSDLSVEGLLRALRTPAKMKIPKTLTAIEPTGDVPMDELHRRWLAAGERWHDLAASLPPSLADEALVMHAVGGPLTFAQTLRFLEAHIDHHLHQLARTVRALNATPA
jgi:hypothetical protein